MKPRNYTFPLKVLKARNLVLGQRIAIKDRDGWAISGIVVAIDLGETIGLVTIDVDVREDEL